MSFQDLVVALAFVGVFVLFFVALLGIIDTLRSRTTRPAMQHILDALRPIVHNGLLAAEQYAQDVFTATGTYLDDFDKKDIADKFYNLIPATVYIAGIPFPVGLVKHWVSQADFERLVQSEYDQFRATILANEAYLTKDLPTAPKKPVSEANRQSSVILVSGNQPNTITAQDTDTLKRSD